ncbi:TIGR02996 domain-containing protein [Gemmata sp. G18]|uniref:TIGR02996 domain-containing protein n=1 Tax=Gemmata palustris TaxID=2822762 RepID=A0ABS5C495_9BACT|nr:TIGR02996 domain-containing protein [Gemmata palustris]MBP3960723.1 TIGR02996 domain-containing protein [Gemmata palustris]
MSLSDRESLLAAIIADPEEDTPRLMFADWLKENGDPDRGEFIRLQVEAAHAEPFSPCARESEAAAQKLLDRFREEWTQPVAERIIGYRFARGFIEHVGVNAATFARDASALFAAAPIRSLLVERFTFTMAPVSLAALFNSPQLTRVKRLDFSKLRRDPDYFDQLAACSHLGQLTDLNLRDLPVPIPWLRALLAGPALPSLIGLDLTDDTNLFEVLTEALPRADHRRLTRIDLSFIRFSSDQIQKTLASRCLRTVEELRFAWRSKPNGPGPLTHLNLGWTIPLDHLRVLDLDGQGVSDPGVGEIIAGTSRRPVPSPLRWLGLANNSLTASAVHALVDSDPARLKLYHLDLRNNGLSASHRVALKGRFPEAEVLV